MRRLFFSAALFCLCSFLYAQDRETIYSRFIKETEDTLWCDMVIWKKTTEADYVFRELKFYNQSMVSVPPGEYVLQYFIDGREVYQDRLEISENESIIILNILEKPMPLQDFDFGKAIYLSVESFFLARDQRVTYIEF
jgi:hypothetical protein